MTVRVRRQVGQKGHFYLHGVELLETLKEKSRKESIVSVSGLATGNTTSADQRDVFRVVKKALLVNTEKEGANSMLAWVSINTNSKGKREGG